jgi:hypothetical protein
MPLNPFSASSVRPDYQRQLEMNTHALLAGDEVYVKRSGRLLGAQSREELQTDREDDGDEEQ